MLALAALVALRTVWEEQLQLESVLGVQVLDSAVWVSLSSESAVSVEPMELVASAALKESVVSAALRQSVVWTALETGLVASVGQESEAVAAVLSLSCSSPVSLSAR